MPDLPVMITIPKIGRFQIRMRRNRSYWLRDPLAHERFALASLRELVRPGDVVYDVGANIGLYTRFMISRFRAGHVFAVEPMRENLVQLKRNITIGNTQEKVTILSVALADVDGEQDIQIDDMSSASAALDSITKGHPAEGRKKYGLPAKKEKVKCRRLDSVVKEAKMGIPNVIKIDVEGAEGLVLLGAREVLEKHGPDLVIELHGADKARQVFTLLSTLGYHCAGKVSPELADGGYSRLTESMVMKAESLYDIHFLLASKNPARLPSRIEEFR